MDDVNANYDTFKRQQSEHLITPPRVPHTGAALVKEIEIPTYDDLKKVADEILEASGQKPTIGIILGSGLGDFAKRINGKDKFIRNYDDIPFVPSPSVPGHVGQLIIGRLTDGPVVACLRGRCHLYEGYHPRVLATPVRLLKLLGIHTLIVTNAAGALNRSYHVGDFMVLKDHVNLPMFGGNSPLIGHNETEFGPRFPGMNLAYCPELRKLAQKTFEDLAISKQYGTRLHEGVYVCQSGPCYETVAECRMFHMLGGDAMGMSTAPDTTVAVHCDLNVLGMSLITNVCILEYDQRDKPNHEEVVVAGKKAQEPMGNLIHEFIKRIPLPK